MRPLSTHSVAAFWAELEKISFVAPRVSGAMKAVKPPRMPNAASHLKPMKAPEINPAFGANANAGVTQLKNNPRVPSNLTPSTQVVKPMGLNSMPQGSPFMPSMG